MWWLYFDTSADVGTRTIADSRDPGRIARLVYTYIHLLLVGGIILSAVGDEFVLAHPLGHTEWPTAIAVVGGPLLFVAGTWIFKWAIVGVRPLSPLFAIVMLAGCSFRAVAAARGADGARDGGADRQRDVGGSHGLLVSGADAVGGGTSAGALDISEGQSLSSTRFEVELRQRRVERRSASWPCADERASEGRSPVWGQAPH